MNIDAPGLNLRSIIDESAPYKQIDVPNSGPSSRAVLVTADQDISIYTVEKGTSMDSYLALPTDALGTEYFVASYNVPSRIRRQDRGSQFLIMGVYENTMVTITLTGTVIHDGQTKRSGAVFSVTLDRLEVMYFVSQDDDLTGTHIESDAPIGVISGSKCADVPAGTAYCDHLVEMIPPVNTWGQNYITSPLRTRSSGDVFRVIASRDNTMVEIEGERIVRETLHSGRFFEFEVPSDQNRIITSSRPVLLMQYSKGGEADNTQADPFMMLVPALEQFPKDPVYFTTPLSSSPPLSHHVNVIVDCQHTGALYHNMFQLPETSFSRLTQLRQRVGNHEYCIAQMDLALGEHMLEHRELEVRFSVALYGFATSQTLGEVAYGMPIGLTLNDAACYGRNSPRIDTATQRNTRQTGPGDITRENYGKFIPTHSPFISFPSNPRDVTAPSAPSTGTGQEKSGRYLMLAIMIGMFSLVTIVFLVIYIVVLKKRIRKLEAERKGYNRIQVSSMMVGPDGYIGLDGSQAGDRDYMTLNQPQGMWRLGRIRRVNGEIQKATPRTNINTIGSPTQISTTQQSQTSNRPSSNDPSPPTSVSSTQERSSSSARNHDMDAAIPLVRQASTRSQPPPSTGRHPGLVVSPPVRQSSFRETAIPPRRKSKSSIDNHINYNASNESTRPKVSHLRRSVSQTEATAHYCGPKSYYSVPKKRPPLNLNLPLYDRPRKRASSVEIPPGIPPHDMLLPRHDDGYMSMKDPRTSVISHGSSVVSKDFSPSSPTSGICEDFPSSPTSVAPLLENKTFSKTPDENHNNANAARGGDADSMDYTELV